jgi:formylglycine-generating enzyme required for sulfatase activity
MKTTWGYRAVVIMAVLLLSATLAHAQGTQLLVTNVLVQVQQPPHFALVDVTYDLETVGDLPVWVSLFLSTDGGATYPNLCATVTGDVGAGVLPGTGKHIVWNAGTEFPGFSSPTCRLRVTADDAANLDDFVYVAPGTFMMGSPLGEPGRNTGETQHQVTLTHGIYVQTTEVTNQQYMEAAQWAYDHGYVTVVSAVYDNGSNKVLKWLGNSDSEIHFSAGVFNCINPDHPVMYVTWFGAAAYCDWLSLMQGLPRAYSHGGALWPCNGGDPYSATGYRLPTEAEWEYACRAGSTAALANGTLSYGGCSPLDPNLDAMGWYCGNAGGWTHPVAQKAPNAWGLHDMHGNLGEWCNDWYGEYGGSVTNPVGPGTGMYPVCRIGNWSEASPGCRSACRGGMGADNALSLIGFRPVRTAN